MALFGWFLVYNLLPSLAAGVITWLVLYAAVNLLKIEHGPYRLPLFYVPLLKATLVLLGIDLVFPWPRSLFGALHAQAVPFRIVLPYFLIWAGLAALSGWILSRRSHVLVQQDARPAQGEMPRLERALDQVIPAYRSLPECSPDREPLMACCADLGLPRPELLLSERLNSPSVLTGSEIPAIVFPAGLVARLDDTELQGALAHELAHLSLRRPAWCSSANLARLAAVSPIASILAAQLHREEEKACDDMAVAILGKPELYAEMLFKSYRFARGQADPLAGRLQGLPQLLGFKPALSERIERLVQPDMPHQDLRVQCGAACLLWLAVFTIL